MNSAFKYVGVKENNICSSDSEFINVSKFVSSYKYNNMNERMFHSKLYNGIDEVQSELGMCESVTTR